MAKRKVVYFNVEHDVKKKLFTMFWVIFGLKFDIQPVSSLKSKFYKCIINQYKKKPHVQFNP
jgi:hypothetical protein